MGNAGCKRGGGGGPKNHDGIYRRHTACVARVVSAAGGQRLLVSRCCIARAKAGALFSQGEDTGYKRGRGSQDAARAARDCREQQ
jgi:hypothetical protein